MINFTIGMAAKTEMFNSNSDLQIDLEMIFKWIVLIIEKKYRKRSKISNSTLTQSQTHTTKDTPKNKKSNKSNKKNDLKGGNPYNISDKKLIKQAFSHDSRGDNTKFIAIARKMVENF